MYQPRYDKITTFLVILNGVYGDALLYPKFKERKLHNGCSIQPHLRHQFLKQTYVGRSKNNVEIHLLGHYPIIRAS